LVPNQTIGLFLNAAATDEYQFNSVVSAWPVKITPWLPPAPPALLLWSSSSTTIPAEFS
jgi:hypothetical protein